MKNNKSDVEFSSMRVTKAFVFWLKIEAAKAGMSMYEFLESRFPGAPKRAKTSRTA